jgi:hypothetical protein
MVGSTVAIVTRSNVTFVEVAKSDKRGKVTLVDGTEWNARNGRRWGNSNPTSHSYYSSTSPRMTTKEDGERTIAFRAEQAAEQTRLAAFKAGAERINRALSVYYANDLEAARAKIAEARAELDQLEKEFA